jgi:hypothetical protein
VFAHHLVHARGDILSCGIESGYVFYALGETEIGGYS